MPDGRDELAQDNNFGRNRDPLTCPNLVAAIGQFRTHREAKETKHETDRAIADAAYRDLGHLLELTHKGVKLKPEYIGALGIKIGKQGRWDFNGLIRQIFISCDKEPPSDDHLSRLAAYASAPYIFRECSSPTEAFEKYTSPGDGRVDRFVRLVRERAPGRRPPAPRKGKPVVIPAGTPIDPDSDIRDQIDADTAGPCIALVHLDGSGGMAHLSTFAVDSPAIRAVARIEKWRVE